MEKFKILFQQVFTISTGILFIIGINGLISHLMGTNFNFAWYYPFSIIFLGFLCTLPTFLFLLSEWSRQNHFILNLSLHCLSIWAITSIAGWIFHWYSTLEQLLIFTIEYIVVYIFVWGASLLLLRAEDKKINQILTDIQDKE